MFYIQIYCFLKQPMHTQYQTMSHDKIEYGFGVPCYELVNSNIDSYAIYHQNKILRTIWF